MTRESPVMRSFVAAVAIGAAAFSLTACEKRNPPVPETTTTPPMTSTTPAPMPSTTASDAMGATPSTSASDAMGSMPPASAASQ